MDIVSFSYFFCALINCLLSASANSDKAYGAFALLNMIIYFVWAIILTVHRKTVMVSQKEVDAANSKEFAAYDGSGGETYNPAIGAAGGGDEYHDQEEL